MKQKIKIGIVDDEILLVEGLVLLLSSHENIEIQCQSIDASEMLLELGKFKPEKLPDVFLVDLKMEPMDGLSFVEILKKYFPAIKIIILTSHYKQAFIGQMVKLGISSFLPKNSSRELLIHVIHEVYKHGVYFTEKDHMMILSYLQNKKSRLDAGLSFTSRELEIIDLICQEYTNLEIADKLLISRRTVETHRQRILDRIGAKNTVGIVVYAVVNQLISLPKDKLYV